MRAGLLSRQGHEQHRLLATNIEMSDRNVDMLAADAAASAFACVSPGTETRHMQVALMKHTASHVCCACICIKLSHSCVVWWATCSS